MKQYMKDFLELLNEPQVKRSGLLEDEILELYRKLLSSNDASDAKEYYFQLLGFVRGLYFTFGDNTWEGIRLKFNSELLNEFHNKFGAL